MRLEFDKCVNAMDNLYFCVISASLKIEESITQMTHSAAAISAMQITTDGRIVLAAS